MSRIPSSLPINENDSKKSRVCVSLDQAEQAALDAAAREGESPSDTMARLLQLAIEVSSRRYRMAQSLATCLGIQLGEIYQDSESSSSWYLPESSKGAFLSIHEEEQDLTPFATLDFLVRKKLKVQQTFVVSGKAWYVANASSKAPGMIAGPIWASVIFSR